MTQQLWDVIVVGSGPAGSAAAIGVRRADPSKSVLLVDRRDFPRDKCCGDAVLGSAFRLLEAHGVATAPLLEGYAATHQLSLVSAGGASVERAMADSMTVLPRLVFDARLREAALTAGASWERHVVRRVRDHGTHVELDGGLQARVVIGADGAESVVRRTLSSGAPRSGAPRSSLGADALGAGPHRRVAVALRAYEAAGDDHVPRLVFDHRAGLAYAWRFPSSAGPANVGYGHLLRPGEASSRAALTAAMHRLLPGLQLDSSTELVHRLPLSTSRQAAADGRILLAGDAASLINPLTGEGIYYAILSGLLAGAAAVDPDGAAARYRAELARALSRHHRHVAIMSALSGRPSLQEAGLRAAAASQRVFDDIAELGLAQGGITTRMGLGIATQLGRRVVSR